MESHVCQIDKNTVVKVGFTGRYAGEKEFNLSPYAGTQVDVSQHRHMAAAEITAGVQSDFFSLKQVHGTRILNAPPVSPAHLEQEADGIVINKPDIPAGILTADCLPVVVVGRDGIALLHCGWRGLAEGIIRRVASFISEPVAAAVGPGISACCYEVQADVASRLARKHEAVILNRGGKLYADLKKYALRELTGIGVAPDSILVSEHCTYCGPELFFSYRRDPGCGRQAGIAVIKKLG